MCGKQCITPLQLSILLGSALKFSSNIYSYYVLEHKISLEVLSHHSYVLLLFRCNVGNEHESPRNNGGWTLSRETRGTGL